MLECIIAVDPGTGKCGLAVVTLNGQVLEKDVVQASDILDRVVSIASREDVKAIVIGDRTGSESFARSLSARNPDLAAKLVKVDEHRTSDEARKRYFEEMPRRGWRRVVPASFQVPPEPYDDFVALILAERFLRNSKGSDGRDKP